MAPRGRGLRKSLHSPEQRALCELLVQARDKAGLTQSRLARRLGKPQSFVAKYEGGERRLDILELLQILGTTGTDPMRFMKALIRRIG
jgi:transcriptional regulator with XRE-family HTH domain